jgi:hypothetical protein
MKISEIRLDLYLLMMELEKKLLLKLQLPWILTKHSTRILMDVILSKEYVSYLPL